MVSNARTQKRQAAASATLLVGARPSATQCRALTMHGFAPGLSGWICADGAAGATAGDGTGGAALGFDLAF